MRKKADQILKPEKLRQIVSLNYKNEKSADFWVVRSYPKPQKRDADHMLKPSKGQFCQNNASFCRNKPL